MAPATLLIQWFICGFSENNFFETCSADHQLILKITNFLEY